MMLQLFLFFWLLLDKWSFRVVIASSLNPLKLQSMKYEDNTCMLLNEHKVQLINVSFPPSMNLPINVFHICWLFPRAGKPTKNSHTKVVYYFTFKFNLNKQVGW